MRGQNATRFDDICGEVLVLLEENGLKQPTQLINIIYETGEWPKDFTAAGTHKIQ
jgi:hypothetical protein